MFSGVTAGDVYFRSGNEGSGARESEKDFYVREKKKCEKRKEGFERKNCGCCSLLKRGDYGNGDKDFDYALFVWKYAHVCLFMKND